MIWFHIPLKSCWQMPLRSFTNRSHPGPLPSSPPFPPSLLPPSLSPQACHSTPVSPIPTSPPCHTHGGFGRQDFREAASAAPTACGSTGAAGGHRRPDSGFPGGSPLLPPPAARTRPVPSKKLLGHGLWLGVEVAAMIRCAPEPRQSL